MKAPKDLSALSPPNLSVLRAPTVTVAEMGEAALLLANGSVGQNSTIEKDMSERNSCRRKASSLLFRSVTVPYQFFLVKEN